MTPTDQMPEDIFINIKDGAVVDGGNLDMRYWTAYVRRDRVDALLEALKDIKSAIPDNDGDYYEGWADEYKLLIQKALAAWEKQM